MGIMSDDAKQLISHIDSVLTQLDRDSLVFLKEQADVLLYNKEVKERNARVREEAGQDSYSEPIARKKESPEKRVFFEQLKNGKFFNLCIGQERLFMDYREVAAMLKIAKAAESVSDASNRLYTWLKRERKDVLVDAHLGSAAHPVLPLIYQELLNSFE